MWLFVVDYKKKYPVKCLQQKKHGLFLLGEEVLRLSGAFRDNSQLMDERLKRGLCEEQRRKDKFLHLDDSELALQRNKATFVGFAQCVRCDIDALACSNQNWLINSGYMKYNFKKHLSVLSADQQSTVWVL